MVLFGKGVHGFIRWGVCGFIWGGMRGFIRGVHGFSRGVCIVFSVFSDTMRYGQ